MFEIIKMVFPDIPFATFGVLLKDELKDCESILDVGCGDNSPLRMIARKKELVGIDGYAGAINKSKKAGIHQKYIKMDIKDIGKKFKPKQFDAVVALDVIEHLKKKDGYNLLKQMEKIARKKVIVFTPNGFLPQIDKVNLLQEHLSGWDTKDFKAREYKVFGAKGLKIFRKNAELRFKPKVISGILSEMSHYFYGKYHPEKSFSLFAIYQAQ